MKKFSIVLLALLLIGGMAFADITLTGSADLSLGYDFDSGDFGLQNGTDTADVEFSFTLDSADASAMGDADVYAVIEMSGSIDVNIDGTDDDDSGTVGDAAGEAGNEIGTSVSIDKAAIVGPDWELDILGMPDSINYATSFQDLDADDDVDADDNDVSGAFGNGNGFKLTMGDISFGANYWNSAAVEYALYAATTMALADGISVDAAAAFDGAFDMGAKLAYDVDPMTVTVAADFNDLGGTSSFDIFGKVGMMVSDADVTLQTYYGNDLAVQGIVDYAPVKVTVTGSTLIAGWDLAAEVAFDATEEIALTLTGGVDAASAWNAGADVVYTAADYTVSVGGGYNSANELSLDAAIENTTLIDGATLKLAYADGTDIGGAANGNVTASVSIAL